MSQFKKIKQFDEEFKKNAIKLYRSSGKTTKEIGEELGVSGSTIRKWVKQSHPQAPISTSLKLMNANEKNIDQEIERLNHKLSIITEERDILKKAFAIFFRDL